MKTKKGKSTLKEVPEAPKSGIIEATCTCTLKTCVCMIVPGAILGPS